MFKKVFNNLNIFCSKRSEGSISQYRNFSIYGFFNTIIPYILWNSHDFLSLVMHISATFLCIILFFYEYWLQSFKKYLQIYWCFTLFFCLPFLSTYALFINNLMIGWTINSVISLFLMSFLVDWLGFLLMLGIGTISGWSLYYLSGGYESNVLFESSNITFVSYTYISAIIIGIIFARKRNEYNEEKEKYLKLIGSAIAHELRTPLMAISMNVKAIKSNFNTIIEESSNSNNENVNVINKSLERIKKTTKESFTIIDMLLMNSKYAFDKKDFSILSVEEIIKDAIEVYPFSEVEKRLVIVDKKNTFDFMGSHLLLKHILFNLFKNALYSIKEANKGCINISISIENEFNILHIKDTGKGMSEDIKDKIFNKFYSRTKHGTGIGLSFCSLVMSAFDGYIECISEEGEFTEFLLYFPIIKKVKLD
jgi:signal transduction histidine kinase